jgi:hypothetical protein
MVTKGMIMVELHSRCCIGCPRQFMVMASSLQLYCSLTCKHLGYSNNNYRQHASTSKVVAIATPEPREYLAKYKRIAALRKAYKAVRVDQLLLESDDD